MIPLPLERINGKSRIESSVTYKFPGMFVYSCFYCFKLLEASPHVIYTPGGDNESAALLPQTVLWELILQYLQSKQRDEERDILIKNFAWLIIMKFLN